MYISRTLTFADSQNLNISQILIFANDQYSKIEKFSWRKHRERQNFLLPRVSSSELYMHPKKNQQKEQCEGARFCAILSKIHSYRLLFRYIQKTSKKIIKNVNKTIMYTFSANLSVGQICFSEGVPVSPQKYGSFSPAPSGRHAGLEKSAICSSITHHYTWNKK